MLGEAQRAVHGEDAPSRRPRAIRLFLTTLLLLAPAAAPADVPDADESFVDRGACPGEGCGYGERWTAREAVVLRAAPDAAAPVVDELVPGEEVETLTGEVHTQPGRLRVVKAQGAFEAGDELLLYTYLGEGFWRVRHDGAVREVDLGFSVWDRRCRSAAEDRCWGVVERAPRFSWWVKVRRASGLEGWVLDSLALEKPGPP